MRVGVVQSSFIPWRGYFDFIDNVDLFVFYDDIQYTDRDWRNRNKIKTQKGLDWLSVSVKYQKRSQLICETQIDNKTQWALKQINKWKNEYRTAPYLDDVMYLLSDIDDCKEQTISSLNIKLIKRICKYLGIVTPMISSEELELTGNKTDRLINLMQQVKGNIYLSGPSADDYLDKELFKKAGVSLEYKSYEYPQYPQLWGDFEGAVTILDLIANCGAESKKYIHSIEPNLVIIE